MKIGVACLRIGAVRLCLAMMLALLVVPGYIVAPSLFAALDSQAMAGEVAGKIFHISMLSLLFFAVAVALFWRRIQTVNVVGRMRWLLLLALLLLVSVNLWVLSPMMADIKLQMGPIDLVAKDDPQRQLFGMWHGISAIVHLLSTLLAGWLVALGAVGHTLPADRKTCPSS
ncbi:MAG: DUF4149 domain-containing protein [Mariprofundus sp.]